MRVQVKQPLPLSQLDPSDVSWMEKVYWDSLEQARGSYDYLTAARYARLLELPDWEAHYWGLHMDEHVYADVLPQPPKPIRWDDFDKRWVWAIPF